MFVVTDLAQQGDQQQNLLQGLANGISSISGVNQADRKRADHATWAIKSLAKTAIDLDNTIYRIRGCSDPNLHQDPAGRHKLMDLASRKPAEVNNDSRAVEESSIVTESVS
jgi:putative protein kinase ArgK-like GTPase of G3E family